MRQPSDHVRDLIGLLPRRDGCLACSRQIEVLFISMNIFSSPTKSSRAGGTTTTTAAIPRWATYRQPATLPPVPTDERLSPAVDKFSRPVRASPTGAWASTVLPKSSTGYSHNHHKSLLQANLEPKSQIALRNVVSR